MVLRLVTVLLLILFGNRVEAQTPYPKTRDEAVRESLININSKDLAVASQAARYFGIFEAKEGVLPMLKVLKQKSFLARSEHHVSTRPSGISEWVFVSVKEDIIAALGAIRDPRAVRVLEKLVRKKRPIDTGPSFNQNVAWALFRITGRLYKYRDTDGSIKTFRPESSVLLKTV